VRRQIAAIELHPFHVLDRRGDLPAFFDRDHPVLAPTSTSASARMRADFGIVVPGDGGHGLRGFFVFGVDGFGPASSAHR